ncbi:MAG: hypothetical protein ACP5II_08245, partial [Infirmifilum sp.]|uniref:hypothetical protein n=1 Tax=Infirmifilum sp. TaxID=2856575 RepID=UPI003D0ED5BB
LIVLTYIPTRTPGSPRLSVSDLPQLFVEAASGLNYSLKLLKLSTHSKVNATYHTLRMQEIVSLLKSYMLGKQQQRGGAVGASV